MRILQRIRRKSGFTLVEIMLVVFVLALTAMMFAATFPTSQISRIKAAHMSYAVSLARQKIEETRSAGYSGVLVTEPVETPLAELPGGTQRVVVTQYASNVKAIEVTITWSGYRKVGGSTTLVTLISDHS
jgi:prepilin-type N-terminal cleavage/methylation domain-containing protein